MTILLALLIGLFNGLRSMTAPAVVAWAVHFGRLPLDWPLSFMGQTVSVVIFTILAVGELVVDKLPWTPNRTDPIGLVARFVAGALTGACVAAGRGASPIVGGICGAIGGLIGAFAGFQARTRLTKACGRGFVVAVVEDLIAIGGCIAVVMTVTG
jgi:uncharacterized membrane protein